MDGLTQSYSFKERLLKCEPIDLGRFGLTQSYLFKERLLKCEPIMGSMIDLGRFVVDLRERRLDYWTPYSDIHPRERNSKRSTYHQ